jgi:Cu/Ag efflux protein CusF
MRHLRTAILAGFAALALAACGAGEKPEGHQAQGVVESVDAAARQVTIDHGEIPGLMGAMTMTFDVADAALLQGIEAGTPVKFSVVYENGTYRVTALEKQ